MDLRLKLRSFLVCHKIRRLSVGQIPSKTSTYLQT